MGKYRTVRVIVACKSVIGPTRNVERQVQRPTECECEDDTDQPAWWVVEIFVVPVGKLQDKTE